MLAGCAAMLIGLVLLTRLSLSVPIRAPLCALWLIGSIRELSRQSRGAYRIKALRLEVGQATAFDRQGRHLPVQIMSGSVVLPRFAWLRLKFADGLQVGELLCGDPAGCEQWRRLQVLWRQDPAAFGGRG